VRTKRRFVRTRIEGRKSRSRSVRTNSAAMRTKWTVERATRARPLPQPEPAPSDVSPDSRQQRANSGEFTQKCPKPKRKPRTTEAKHTPEDRRGLEKAITRMTGRVPSDDNLDGLLAALGDCPVEGFCNYLQRLPAKFQLGGRNAPRKLAAAGSYQPRAPTCEPRSPSLLPKNDAGMGSPTEVAATRQQPTKPMTIPLTIAKGHDPR